MRATSTLSLLAALSLVTAACSPPADRADGADATATSTAEDRAAIQQLIEDFDASTAAGDVDALMATYTADPVALPPGAPVARGAEAVRELWGAFLAQGDVVTENTGRRTRVSGDLATTWGTWTSTVTAEDGTETADAGKFMFVAVRQSDGSWKSAVNIWNSDTTPETAGS